MDNAQRLAKLLSLLEEGMEQATAATQEVNTKSAEVLETVRLQHGPAIGFATMRFVELQRSVTLMCKLALMSMPKPEAKVVVEVMVPLISHNVEVILALANTPDKEGLSKLLDALTKVECERIDKADDVITRMSARIDELRDDEKKDGAQ